jgi:hypothetical protein
MMVKPILKSDGGGVEIEILEHVFGDLLIERVLFVRGIVVQLVLA